MFFEWKTGKGMAVANINGRGYEEMTDEVKSDLVKKIEEVNKNKGGAIGEVIDRIYSLRGNLKDFVSKIPEISQFGTIGILNEEGSFQPAEGIIGKDKCNFVNSLNDCSPQDIFVLMYSGKRYPENIKNAPS
ncbi:MAG: hypothetical protein AABX65_02705 [Nanoarchaeota archaeon]